MRRGSDWKYRDGVCDSRDRESISDAATATIATVKGSSGYRSGGRSGDRSRNGQGDKRCDGSG